MRVFVIGALITVSCKSVAKPLVISPFCLNQLGVKELRSRSYPCLDIDWTNYEQSRFAFCLIIESADTSLAFFTLWMQKFAPADQEQFPEKTSRKFSCRIFELYSFTIFFSLFGVKRKSRSLLFWSSDIWWSNYVRFTQKWVLDGDVTATGYLGGKRQWLRSLDWVFWFLI